MALLLDGIMPLASDTVYLIDASIYVFRSWFSLPDTLTSAEGRPVNAAYGFLRFVTEFVEQTQPSRIMLAFDGSLTTSFRNEIFAEYKTNREQPPAELAEQFEICRALVTALGMKNLVHSRFEADDLIATAASNVRKLGLRSAVISSDKDLAQVIEKHDIWWNFPKNHHLSVDGIHQRFGVWPHQISDYLALVGDSVDNIPGVPGIGAKTAARILRVYPSLEIIYENLPQISQLAIRGASKIAANLRDHGEQAFTARKLTTLVKEVPMDDEDEYRVQTADREELDRIIRLIDRGQGFVERITQVLKN